MVSGSIVSRSAITERRCAIDNPVDDGGLLGRTQILQDGAVVMQIALAVM